MPLQLSLGWRNSNEHENVEDYTSTFFLLMGIAWELWKRMLLNPTSYSCRPFRERVRGPPSAEYEYEEVAVYAEFYSANLDMRSVNAFEFC